MRKNKVPRKRKPGQVLSGDNRDRDKGTEGDDWYVIDQYSY